MCIFSHSSGPFFAILANKQSIANLVGNSQGDGVVVGATSGMVGVGNSSEGGRFGATASLV